jgi:DnaK suppressor protein
MDRPDAPDAAADPRAVLLEQREQLLAELEEIAVRAPEPMTYGSQAAAASQVFEQQRDLALREHTRTAVAVIDAALARMDAGTYGMCTSCGRPIGAERLQALPAAALCIDCQRTKGNR